MSYFPIRKSKIIKKEYNEDQEKANCRCTPNNNHKNICMVMVILFPLIFLSLGFYIFYIIPLQDNILSGDGYQIEFEYSITTINRYNFTSGGLTPAPSSAIETQYLEDFNDGVENWTDSVLGITTNVPKFVYEGARSYRFFGLPTGNGGYSRLVQNFTAGWNESQDIVFYTMTEKAVSNGYYYFQVELAWEYGAYNVTFLIANGTTAGYTTNSSTERVVTLSTPNVGIYCGYLIKNIRDYVVSQDVTLIDMPYNITRMEYRLMSSSLERAHLDYIMIQKRPYTTSCNWYELGVPKTDYQLSINYTIYIDSRIINETSLQLTIDLYETIANLSFTYPEFLSERVLLSGFSFTGTVFNIYDKYTTGSYTGILHTFPKNDYLGANLTYTFWGDLTGYGDKIDGEVASANKSKSIDGFSVDYMCPILVL